MKSLFQEYSQKDWIEIRNELAFYGDQPVDAIGRAPKKDMLSYLEYALKRLSNKK